MQGVATFVSACCLEDIGAAQYCMAQRSDGFPLGVNITTVARHGGIDSVLPVPHEKVELGSGGKGDFAVLRRPLAKQQEDVKEEGR